MGLDGTIRRRDRLPLGTLYDVEQALSSVLPGITFAWTPSGKDWFATAEAGGVTFPDVIKQHFANRPPQRQADFQAEDWSIVFHLGDGEPLEHIDVVLRGETINSSPILDQFLIDMDWEIGFPDVE